MQQLLLPTAFVPLQYSLLWAIISQPCVDFHLVGDAASQRQPGTRCTLMKTRTLNREDWVLYWHLHQSGKNILMPIFLSEVNGQQPPPPPSHPYFNHLSVWLNCVYISPCRRSSVPTLAPQSPFHAADGSRWLQIVTLYAPRKWVIWGKGVCARVSGIETHTLEQRRSGEVTTIRS